MPKFETIDEVIGRWPPERQAEIEAEAEGISAAIESARLKSEATAKKEVWRVADAIFRSFR